MKAIATGDKEGVELAKSLGIKLDGLASMSIHFMAGKVVTLVATYHLEQDDIHDLQGVLYHFEAKENE